MGLSTIAVLEGMYTEMLKFLLQKGSFLYGNGWWCPCSRRPCPPNRFLKKILRG